MRLDWCVESCDRIIGEIDICIFMDYRFGGRSDMLDIQISDTFMNNKSVAKIQQIMSMAWQFDLWKSTGFTFRERPSPLYLGKMSIGHWTLDIRQSSFYI